MKAKNKNEFVDRIFYMLEEDDMAAADKCKVLSSAYNRSLKEKKDDETKTEDKNPAN